MERLLDMSGKSVDYVISWMATNLEILPEMVVITDCISDMSQFDL